MPQKATLKSALLELADQKDQVQQHLALLDPYLEIIRQDSWPLAQQEEINAQGMCRALSRATGREVRRIIPCSVNTAIPVSWMTAEAFANALDTSLNSGPSHPLGLWDRAVDKLPMMSAREAPVGAALKPDLLDPLELVLRRSFTGPLQDKLRHYIGCGILTALQLFWLPLVAGGKEYSRWELLVRDMWQTPVIGPLKCQKGECDIWIVACA